MQAVAQKPEQSVLNSMTQYQEETARHRVQERTRHSEKIRIFPEMEVPVYTCVRLGKIHE